ncbi:MAG: hypothetical protein DRZ79_00340 [Candidatus Cloacimonadota bacterium]|nr:MAG: hypothetical protein DRZ79_00340 [Candidatus Cloacimonadota bacterium]
MKKIGFIWAIVSMFLNLSATKYAGEIFHFGAGVRNFALGNCGVSDENSFALAYWNASLLSEVQDNKFEIMHSEEYSGLLSYDAVSLIFGNDNKFSLFISRIGIDNIPLTKLTNSSAPPDSMNRPYEYKSISDYDFVAYFGFSRKLKNFHLGLSPKIAFRKLAEKTGFGFGADISSHAKITPKMVLAARLRDFFSTQIFWENGTHEIVNPSLDVEMNYNFLLPIFKFNSIFFGRLEFLAESRKTAAAFNFGIFSLDYHLGLETKIHRQVNLLFGYDIDNLTTGISVGYKNWFLNYSLELDSSELDNSHRISISCKL